MPEQISTMWNLCCTSAPMHQLLSWVGQQQQAPGRAGSCFTPAQHLILMPTCTAQPLIPRHRPICPAGLAQPEPASGWGGQAQRCCLRGTAAAAGAVHASGLGLHPVGGAGDGVRGGTGVRVSGRPSRPLLWSTLELCSRPLLTLPGRLLSFLPAVTGEALVLVEPTDHATQDPHVNAPLDPLLQGGGAGAWEGGRVADTF